MPREFNPLCGRRQSVYRAELVAVIVAAKLAKSAVVKGVVRLQHFELAHKSWIHRKIVISGLGYGAYLKTVF